jgi:putative membrane protein
MAPSSRQEPVQLAALRDVSPKRAVAAILGVSAAALGLLIFVIYGHGRAASPPEWVGHLPALNALFNGTSAVFLLLALRSIRSRKVAEHARYMLGALASSALFLVSYIVYHSVHGDSKFQGQGVIRPVYFVVLVSHIVLSALVLPLIFTSFFYSLAGRFPQHRKVARVALPVWLYVSVTGVLVFVMLRSYG